MFVLCLLLGVLMVSPVWFTSSKLKIFQYYCLLAAVLLTMISCTPTRASNSAPFEKFPQLLIALFSCSLVMSYVDFCASDGKGHQALGDHSCVCRNENAFATLAYCYQTGFPLEFDSLIDMCNTNYNTSLDLSLVTEALERYHNSARDVVNFEFLPHVTAVDFPAKLSEEKIFRYKGSYDQFLGNYNRSMDYGWYMVVFWILVFALAAIGNWIKFICPSFVKTLTWPILRKFRSRVTLPALSGTERNSEKQLWSIIDYLPPSRAESLIICVFSLLVLHFCFYKVRFVPQDPIFDTKLDAYMRYFAVRSGIIASSLVPLSVLFAGRNNILQWITGWGYSIFIMFHRWISRVIMVLVVVHSLGYIKQIIRPVNQIETYVIFGVIGTVSGLIILVQGLLVLRRKWYEMFLAAHIFLAALFLLGAWVHVQDLNFLWYYYISVCLWIFDRVLRIQRLCTFGFPNAKVQLYEDNTLKFRVPVPLGFHVVAGGHCFLHFLHWSCFWQSHPFTYTVIDGDIVFYVKVKKGITERLKFYLEKHPSKTALMRIAVEGSYGEKTPAENYNKSVFIAGGNGIPGIYAEAIEIAKQSRRHSKVKLIWVVRDYVSILWFYEELRDLEQLDIETDIYVSRFQTEDYTIASDKLALTENSFTYQTYQSTNDICDVRKRVRENLKNVTFKSGRPDIFKIVETNCEVSTGSTCFVACGHPNMVDEVRHQVAQKVAHCEKRVDFFEQLQVWA